MAEGILYNLDTFATYYNLTYATHWSCMLTPELRKIVQATLGTSLSPHNVYFEILESTEHPAGLATLTVTGGTPSFTPGDGVDPDLYAGGYGQLKLSGITGSGLVTVSGSWRKIDGTIGTGDGTATISSTTDSPAALTPPFTNALLVSVSTITRGTGITAGTIVAEAARPPGRDNPPT